MKTIASHELLSKYTHSFFFESFSALSTISESGSLRTEKRSDEFCAWSKKAGQQWAWACHRCPRRELWDDGFCSMFCYCLVACPHPLFPNYSLLLLKHDTKLLIRVDCSSTFPSCKLYSMRGNPRKSSIWNVSCAMVGRKERERGEVGSAFTPWFFVKLNRCQHVSFWQVPKQILKLLRDV